MYYKILYPILVVLGMTLMSSHVLAQNPDESDFGFTMKVADQQANKDLKIGFDEEATESFDENFDQFAPPAPPSSAFDARLKGSGDDFFIDIRAPKDSLVFELAYAAASGEGPIMISWDPSVIPDSLDLIIVDAIAGNLFNLDMTQQSSITNEDNNFVEDGFKVIVENADGSKISTDIEEGLQGIPTEFTLNQNFPNPFNPSTTIEYGLPSSAEVRLTVYNIMGQEVATLVNQRQSSGFHSISFDASRVASGMYLYRIEAGSFTETRKLMLVK